jgi:hypothetical protein
MTTRAIKPLSINARQGNVLKMEGGGFVPVIDDSKQNFKEDVLSNLRRAIRKHSTDLISDANLIQPLAAELGVYEAVLTKVANDGPVVNEPVAEDPPVETPTP